MHFFLFYPFTHHPNLCIFLVQWRRLSLTHHLNLCIFQLCNSSYNGDVYPVHRTAYSSQHGYSRSWMGCKSMRGAGQGRTGVAGCLATATRRAGTWLTCRTLIYPQIDSPTSRPVQYLLHVDAPHAHTHTRRHERNLSGMKQDACANSLQLCHELCKKEIRMLHFVEWAPIANNFGF